jgi:uncharacterized protein (DUF3820 family)
MPECESHFRGHDFARGAQTWANAAQLRRAVKPPQNRREFAWRICVATRVATRERQGRGRCGPGFAVTVAGPACMKPRGQSRLITANSGQSRPIATKPACRARPARFVAGCARGHGAAWPILPKRSRPMQPEDLQRLLTTAMPYGKYKGRMIADLPGNYLNWFAREGFPKGEIGRLLALMQEIDHNGLKPLLDPLRGK